MTREERIARLEERAGRLGLMLSRFGSPPRWTVHFDNMVTKQTAAPASTIAFGRWGLTLEEVHILLDLMGAAMQARQPEQQETT